jgi:hypothetical protein
MPYALLEAFRSGDVLRLPSSSLSPARSRGCREADALGAIQPQPKSVALSKSSAQDILSFVLLAQKPTARDGTRAFQAKRCGPTTAFPTIRRPCLLLRRLKADQISWPRRRQPQTVPLFRFLKRDRYPSPHRNGQVRISFPPRLVYLELFGQAPTGTAFPTRPSYRKIVTARSNCGRCGSMIGNPALKSYTPVSALARSPAKGRGGYYSRR